MNNAIAPFHATILIGSEEKAAREGAGDRSGHGVHRPGQRLRRVPGLPQDGGGHSPDVIPVERFMEAKDVGGELKVGPIRDLRSDAFIRPNEARSKVYLIENAQNMNPNAQNALLKVLEEGPPYAAFLLMTDRAGALLETIRSRCAAIHVGEDDNGDETDAQALAFAQLLVSGDEFQRADFLVRFENAKPDRPDAGALSERAGGTAERRGDRLRHRALSQSGGPESGRRPELRPAAGLGGDRPQGAGYAAVSCGRLPPAGLACRPAQLICLCQGEHFYD